MIINYLEAGRRKNAPQHGVFPFTEEAVTLIINNSFGNPRICNAICWNVLHEAALSQQPVVDDDILFACWQRSADNLKQSMLSDLRNLHEWLSETVKEGLIPKEATDEMFDKLGVDSSEALLTKCQQLMRDDFLVGVETDSEGKFVLSPMLNPPQRD